MRQGASCVSPAQYPPAPDKKEGLPCRNPASAMPSMESCGIDVYNTTKGTELKYSNGENTVTYFGIALFREESHA